MIKEQALKYMGFNHQPLSDDFNQLYDECEKEVIEHSHFKVIQQTYPLSQDLMIEGINISIDYPDSRIYLKGCHHIMVMGATLSIELERYLTYISKLDMSKAVICDAIASSYLEFCVDQYEESLKLKDRTFRFAPGYGDIPLSLNKAFYQSLDMYKNIGVTLSDSGLFIPQKSMLCFIGLGKDARSKQCGHCIKRNDCSFRKENKRCWID